ncbi:MAG: TonB-dependent receptor, partial [Pseudomonadota bacterium]|nr:TonB-dependent receptor [Pseudomonadota bacterium]
MGRGSVGVTAIGQPQWGFDPNSGPTNNIPRAGGNGWIPVKPDGSRVNNSADRSFVGNVRNPTTLDYYSRTDPAGLGFTRTFPGAATYCLANANLPQNNPAGGCLEDNRQATQQVQPAQETGSFFARATKAITPEIEGFLEFGFYHAKTSVNLPPIATNGAYFTADGAAHSQTAVTQLGASHPDNPYFGTPARLAYQGLFDYGSAPVDSTSHAIRFVGGVKGTWSGFDFDTGVTYSEARQTDTSKNTINWRVKNALFDPSPANVAIATAFSPAYAALPAGTVWRIGENAGLNSPAMYAAVLANQERNGFSKLYGADFKVSREFGQLAGGPIGVAVGAEVRRESNELPLYTGFGDFVGLSLTAYGGSRNIYATYAEVALPVLKQLELSAALRYDHYTDAGDSLTPKFGAKWRVVSNFALRGTYAQAFRAPSSTENSPTSIAAFGGPAINDTARCASLAGLPQATIDANCKGISPTFVQRGNPDLKPEKSDSYTLGLVWDLTPKSSITADLWRIKRKGL